MNTQVPALTINIKALDKNLGQAGENQNIIAGATPAEYDGFGQVKDIANPDNIAYFFADYMSDDTILNGPYSNLRLSTANAGDGGRKLIEDIAQRSGSDGVLSMDELQAWADEVGFTGDVAEIMNAFGEMDDYLCGEGVLDVDMYNQDELVDDTLETSEQTEETQEATESNSRRGDLDTSLMDVGVAFYEWGLNVIKSIWDLIF